MILDSSAFVAILTREPEATLFSEAILRAEHCLLSVANYLEVTMVLSGQLGPAVALHIDAFITHSGIVIEPVTVEQGRVARQAFLEYGKGRHPAALNFGDCFAYALAKITREPLLYKGDDFRRTDLIAAC